MSNSVIISEVSDLMLVSIHHIPRETGFMDTKPFAAVDPHSHFIALDSNSNNIYTMWSGGRPFMGNGGYDVFLLNQNCTYEAITAIDLLGNSSIPNTKLHHQFQ